MTPSGIITLTTDFGTHDPYAGIMKGIIYCSNPNAKIVDISHHIRPHDIINGAFIFQRSYHHFPDGTVHVAVVDPGVGGSRKNIAVTCDRCFFVGPDNGILSLALENEKNCEIREITNTPFILNKISDTFHGRDVFAPCAGHLSAGTDFSGVGNVLKHHVSLNYPKVQHEKNVIKGEVVSIDTFGNMITNISEQTFKSFTGKQKFEIFFGAERFDKILSHYSEVPRGEPLVLFGSCGFLEISMNEGSAADYFMITVGSPLTVRKY